MAGLIFWRWAKRRASGNGFGLASFILGWVALVSTFAFAPWQTGNGSLYSVSRWSPSHC